MPSKRSLAGDAILFRPSLKRGVADAQSLRGVGEPDEVGRVHAGIMADSVDILLPKPTESTDRAVAGTMLPWTDSIHARDSRESANRELRL